MIVAVYGSLMTGHYNNHMMSGEKLGEITISGSMFLAVSYPKLFLSGVTNPFPDKVTVHNAEVWEIDSSSFEDINEMELNSGYMSLRIKTPYGTATCWPYDPRHKFTVREDQWIPAYTPEMGKG